jgi:mRNA-degrading endonuclease RelE of RelBE toxin-antitoxin system
VAVRILATENFENNADKLSKHYRHIYDDIDPLLERLRKGETPGDHVPGVRFTAYKARVKSSDQQSGQSGGFRVVYYVKTAECIYLITIYAKVKQVDIKPKALKRLIEDCLKGVDLAC